MNGVARMTWAEAIIDAEAEIKELSAQIDPLERRVKRLRAAIRLMRDFVRDGRPWPGDEANTALGVDGGYVTLPETDHTGKA